MKTLLVSIASLVVLAPSAALAQTENDPGSEGLQPEPGSPPAGPAGELEELPAEEGPASEVDYQTFHDALSPYGSWVNTDEYGWVWMPADVDQEWRPYSDGQWLWTSYGWTWSGSEAWAWAPYHYGRWCYLNNMGWGWVPGYVWGPAWVAWRTGGDFVGWTPLFPGYPYGGAWLGTYPVYYNQWCFTGYGAFWGAPVTGHLYPTAYVQSNVWGHTHSVTPVQSGGAVYSGPSHAVVAAAVGHPITPVAIHPVAAASQAGFRSSANSMNVYAPRFQAAAHPFATRHGGISPSVSAVQLRGVGSLVRQGAMAPSAQAGAPRVARAPAGPVQAGAHPPKAAGVQPYRGAVPPAPTAPHGNGGGGTVHPTGHPAPQAQRAMPPTGTFSTYHANPSYPASGESSMEPSAGNVRGSAGAYASGYGDTNRGATWSGGGYGTYGTAQSNTTYRGAASRPNYGTAAGSHPSYNGGSHPASGGGTHPMSGGGSHPGNGASATSPHPSYPVAGAAAVHPASPSASYHATSGGGGSGRH